MDRGFFLSNHQTANAFLFLDRVKMTLANHTILAHLMLEMKLKEERSEVLLQEELFWWQKARMEWLKCGDKNSKFSHTITLSRRRRNRIEALLNDDGFWIQDNKALKSMALQFYADLFASDPNSGGDFPKGRFLQIDDVVKQHLEEGYSMEQVSVALKTMWSLKAHGSDGFQDVFFKKTWDITGWAVYDFVQKVLEGGMVPGETSK